MTEEIQPTSPDNLKVLVGCEFSGVVRNAFRALGHDAYSCDLLDSDDKSKYHIKGDVLEILDEGWDLAIFHPPCPYLTISANKWFKPELDTFSERQHDREDAVDFFMKFVNCSIPKVAIENPIGVMSSMYRKPDQILQPWMFGHGETKATCLWLKGLPKLEPTNIVEGREQRLHYLPKTEDRWKLRSITFQGIANAMATQWTRPLQTTLEML